LPRVSQHRIVIVAFGTRGDVQPFCVLGRALQDRGHAVTLATIAEYAGLVASFGVPCEPIEAHFDTWLRSGAFDAVLHGFFSRAGMRIGTIRRLARELEDKAFTLLSGSLDAIRGADLVVYNPFAFFAGLMARELAIPSVSVTCQPLLPSSRASFCFFGGQDRGALVNRASYETMRGLSFLLRRAFARFRKVSGTGRSLRTLGNPLTATLRVSHHVAAFSLAVSPDPGDWPVTPTATGFWFRETAPHARLPDDVTTFIEAGEPPVYIGFGSMLWGAARTTAVVRKALDMWGGRAIVSLEGGGLLPGRTPANVLPVQAIDHALLFPRLAGCVHHGGAGTTAQALRSGIGSVVLPVLGDQLYWGHRVQAIGAGGAPHLLSKITPGELACRLADLVASTPYRDAARRTAAVLDREPGVRGAVDLMETILSKPVRTSG
jgi:sterol 3beta-glucosyltransferase